MRVIAGTYRGHPLLPVPSKNTRPTTDRVREAWASTVENLLAVSLDRAVVLDAFAGSGALGIEMLSRGAARVVFCEYSSAATGTIKKNLTSLGLFGSEQATLLTTDTFKPKTLTFLQRFAPFDLVILDPPYSTSLAKINELLAAIAAAPFLSPASIVSYEHAFAQRLDDEECAQWLQTIDTPALSSYSLVSRKIYGTAALDYFRYNVEQGDEILLPKQEK